MMWGIFIVFLERLILDQMIQKNDVVLEIFDNVINFYEDFLLFGPDLTILGGAAQRT